MAVFELPAIVALLLVQSPLTPPNPATHADGEAPAVSTAASISGLEHAGRTRPTTQPAPPSATNQTDGERTPTDVCDTLR
jgi:hypothetical protein